MTDSLIPLKASQPVVSHRTSSMGVKDPTNMCSHELFQLATFTGRTLWSAMSAYVVMLVPRKDMSEAQTLVQDMSIARQSADWMP